MTATEQKRSPSSYLVLDLVPLSASQPLTKVVAASTLWGIIWPVLSQTQLSHQSHWTQADYIGTLTQAHPFKLTIGNHFTYFHRDRESLAKWQDREMCFKLKKGKKQGKNMKTLLKQEIIHQIKIKAFLFIFFIILCICFIFFSFSLHSAFGFLLAFFLIV